MDIPIQVDLGRIAQDLQIRRVQVESVVQLLDEGNTVPFITRYRKERTGNLNEVVIREIQLRVQRLRDLAERKETILKAIEAQGKLTPDLTIAIRSADNPKRLEDLYLPFKPKKRTKASDARDRGLEPLAFRIWTRDETLTDLPAAAQELVSAEKGIDTIEKVLEGVGHILAEAISEMATVRDGIRKVVWKIGKIVTSKAELPEGQGLEYRDYFDYAEPVAQIPPHRILAINRGDKEGPLKVRIDVARPDLEAVLFSQLPLEGHPQAELFRAAAIDALDRLILPSMEREVRRDLTEGAEKHAVEVFAKNLRGLLLQPPIPKQVVLAIDPGFRTGCKVAVLDRGGNLVDQTVIYPHAPQNRRSEAKVTLKDLVGKHGVGVVAIGNGTACRETEELVAEIIAEGTRFSSPDYVATAPVEVAPAAAPAEPAAQGAAAPADIPAQGEPAPADIPAQDAAAPADVAAESAGAPGDVPTEGTAAPSVEPVAVAPEHAREPFVDPISEESRQNHDVSSEHNAAHVHENALAPATDGTAVGDSHAARANHSHPAEAPLEMLPPISGGSPEATSPEAEIEAAPDGSSTPVDTGSGAVLNEREGEHEEARPADPPVAAAEAVASESPESPHEPIVAGSQVPVESVAPPVAETPPARAEEAATPEAAAQPPAAAEPAPPAEPVAAASPAAGGAAAPPAPRPPRPPKQGGQGKSESRSRSSRPRHGPPPPPEPPRPHSADPQLAQLAYVVVNEAGASVYSTSQVGREELPELDATLRSGISIGRRLQDPLAEMVKIEPQSIGVGLYQHDVNPKQLKETLESVIASCVNFVGVDLNTASVPLLRHVSGLNQLTARRIVDYRKERGTFANREQLTQVEGVGPATFTQAAGFLKVPDGENPLDRTWIHPESYPAAVKLLDKLGFTPDVVRDKVRLPELNEQLAKADVAELSRELEVGEFTLRDIIEALARPERDPREDLPKPIFKKGILKIEDLSAGMELKGTVLNVVDFGAFVDIGLKDSGLVHISQLANRYVKSPHDVVSVGDVVTVWVMGVDQERKRVSLTMVKPGTERPRGQQGGGARRGAGEPGEPREGDRGNRGGGQGRRGGGGGGGGARPPRPAASALTSPPVGSPSVAILAEAPAPRRPERERGGHPAGGGGSRFPDNRGQGPGHGGAPSQHGGGPPRHGQGQGPDSGPPGRGGPRGPYPGQGQGQAQGPGDRPPRQDRGPGSRPPGRPYRPSPPPPPLSKDALAGNVPLRTFGQLKQLWEAKVEPKAETKGEASPGSGGKPPEPSSQPSHGAAEAAIQPERGPEAANAASAAPAETDPQGASH